MFRAGVSPRLFFVCVAVVLYCVVITVKLLSVDLSRRELCPPQPTCEVLESTRQLQETVQYAQQSLQHTQETVPPWEQHLDFDGFNNDTGTPDGHYIVPNYVHFIKFGQAEFSFVQAVCVLAALKNQRPEKLFFHTDLDEFRGKYWDVMMSVPGFKEVLVVRRMEVPTHIFGQRLNQKWKYYHGGDVARLLVMREFGGIYLDSDSYIVRSLDDFRRYEMSLGWLPGRDMGNQVLLAHKDSRFLRLWYESYKDNYEHDCWYCNAGTYPTNRILRVNPHVVHRVDKLFGNYGIKQKIYLTEFPEWRDYYAFHLLSSRLYRGLQNNQGLRYPVVFNEVNVLNYPVAFRDMCKDVYPFPER